MPKRFTQTVKEGATVPAAAPSETVEVEQDQESEYAELMRLAAEPLDLSE